MDLFLTVMTTINVLLLTAILVVFLRSVSRASRRAVAIAARLAGEGRPDLESNLIQFPLDLDEDRR